MRMSELLNEVRRFSLDEGFSPREIKMAIGIASDPRYAKGNMTGAVTAIERMKKGLSDHPQVAAVLKRQNEDLDEASKEGTIKIIKTKDGKFQIQKMTKGKFVDIGKPHNSAKEAEKFRSGQPDLFGEAVSMAQQAAIAISKKERGEKPKEEGNTFGKELKSARDKGEKTFVVSGKKYNVEDYDIDEAKKKPVSQMTPKEKEADAARRKEYKAYQKSKRNEEGEASRIVEPYRPEFGLDEAPKMTYALVGTDMKIYAIGDEKEMNLNRRSLEKRLKDVSPLKIARLKTAQSIGDKVDKSQLKEEVEIDESMKMTDPKLLKMFDKLKSKDTVKIKYDSTLEKGTDFIEFTVKSKGTVRNGQVEKITLAAKGNPMAAKRFMYKKDGKVTFATGDMAASIVDIKESIKRALLKLESVDLDEAKQPKIDAVFGFDPDFDKKGGSSSKDIKKYGLKVDDVDQDSDGYMQVQVTGTMDQMVKMVAGMGTADEDTPAENPRMEISMRDFSDDEEKKLNTRKYSVMQSATPSKMNKYFSRSGIQDEVLSGSKNNLQLMILDVMSLGKAKKSFPDVFSVYVNESLNLGEKYDLYHKDFSDAMQHAYSYAKSKMGITVDPKEIDNKVATGPKKPSEGKTNTYKLKGKGGNLQIQVYNKGGSKPFELNMYKEENALIPESNDLISQTVNLITYTQMQEKQDSADVDDDASQKDVDDAAKNIIMQLRKSVSMRGDKEVEFAAIGHGYKKKVDMKIAQKALDMYNKMKPQDKTKFQTTIAKSYKDLLNAIKGK